MSSLVDPTGVSRWYEAIDRFVRELPYPTTADRDQLDALGDWQRRITGGNLIQFFELLQDDSLVEIYPILKKYPLEERIFVALVDTPGMAAAQELMDINSDMALCIHRNAWHAWIDDPEVNADEEFAFHYQFWSVWHQNLPSTWDFEMEDGAEYWVHEEGFALADRAGRGAQHLWKWDGSELTLVNETMTSWVS